MISVARKRAFLDDMNASLGPRAMRGLEQLRDTLGLDQYSGADFAVAPDGRLLLFEANATMAIVPPPRLIPRKGLSPQAHRRCHRRSPRHAV